MTQYLKRREVFDAVQWHTDSVSLNVRPSTPDPDGTDRGPCPDCGLSHPKHGELMNHPLVKGNPKVCPGDWIVSPVSHVDPGYRMPCDVFHPDAFERLHESIPEPVVAGS